MQHKHLSRSASAKVIGNSALLDSLRRSLRAKHYSIRTERLRNISAIYDARDKGGIAGAVVNAIRRLILGGEPGFAT